jgi:hypothetical protein
MLNPGAGENYDTPSASEYDSDDLWTSAAPPESHAAFYHEHSHAHEPHYHAHEHEHEHAHEHEHEHEHEHDRKAHYHVDRAGDSPPWDPLGPGGEEALSHAPVQAIIPHKVSWDPAYFRGVGCPFEDASHWHEQQGTSSCALVSQLSISEALMHHTFTEDQFCRFAQEHHWFDPASGTPPEHADKLLNACGIETDKGYHASVSDMVDALEHGDKVLVCVNANAIWTPLRDTETGLPVAQNISGHAIWVTGIDKAPNGSLKVIINDSGIAEGSMTPVDMADFVNAWDDYDNFLVVAHAPALSAA